jgi:hypothetical protein
MQNNVVVLLVPGLHVTQANVAPMMAQLTKVLQEA